VSVDAAELSRLIAGHFTQDPPETLGVAVSGGSDSVALLILLHDWSQSGGPRLHAVSVDHGLRPESAGEAEDVAKLCASLGIPHKTLHWQWDGTGNLPDQARRGRYEAMAEWATDKGIHDIALGHTQDDLAETFLMRLSRGAGLDGLSAMAARRQVKGVTLHRPMLSIPRLALRDVLTKRAIPWADDPSNDDPAYDRTLARRALSVLAPLGITSPGLANVAQNLREARDALGQVAVRLASDIVSFDAGDILMTRAALLEQPSELQRRLVQGALQWVGNDGYPPRGPALMRALNAVQAGEACTLHGCRLLIRNTYLRITREWSAVEGQRCNTDEIWDARWQFHGFETGELYISALGEAGLKHCPDRKASGRPAASLIASPAIWQGDTLVAAPLAGLSNGWRATRLHDAADYNAALLSH